MVFQRIPPMHKQQSAANYFHLKISSHGKCTTIGITEDLRCPMNLSYHTKRQM
ncbi:hypothetical protein LINGRAHAP2_LOCUS11484 [Linum grandiflorum]